MLHGAGAASVAGAAAGIWLSPDSEPHFLSHALEFRIKFQKVLKYRDKNFTNIKYNPPIPTQVPSCKFNSMYSRAALDET
jgi:hypothetical protein